VSEEQRLSYETVKRALSAASFVIILLIQINLLVATGQRRNYVTPLGSATESNSPSVSLSICKRCGEKYQDPHSCFDLELTDEQIKHLHLTPEEKAPRIKEFHEMAKRLKSRHLPSEDEASTLESARRMFSRGLSKEDVTVSEKTP
jgi:hypothetical protein